MRTWLLRVSMATDPAWSISTSPGPSSPVTAPAIEASRMRPDALTTCTRAHVGDVELAAAQAQLDAEPRRDAHRELDARPAGQFVPLRQGRGELHDRPVRGDGERDLLRQRVGHLLVAAVDDAREVDREGVARLAEDRHRGAVQLHGHRADGGRHLDLVLAFVVLLDPVLPDVAADPRPPRREPAAGVGRGRHGQLIDQQADDGKAGNEQ